MALLDIVQGESLAGLLMGFAGTTNKDWHPIAGLDGLARFAHDRLAKHKIYWGGQMWRIGFGFERLGLLAVKNPRIFTLLLAMLVGFCIFHLPKLKFNGNVLTILPTQSQAYRDFIDFKTNFRNFTSDVRILIKSDNIASAEGMEALRQMQLELSLVEGIANVSTIFSVPHFDADSGEFVEWFPQDFQSDIQAQQSLKTFFKTYPPARGLFSSEHKIALMVASLEPETAKNDDAAYQTYRLLREEAETIKPDDFQLHYAGYLPIGETVAGALLSEQVKLSFFGLLFGTVLAFLIFRNFLAALICALAPGLTVLWSASIFAIADLPINFLTLVLPTLALIVAFADGIFLYFKWQMLNAKQPDFDFSLNRAIRLVGPASSLTSITTAIAFLAFLASSSEALRLFGILGALSVLMAFVAVITGLPLALYWLYRFGIIKTGRSQKPLFQGIGRYVRVLPMRWPVITGSAGLVLFGLLTYAPGQLTPDYKLAEILPENSDVLVAERLADAVSGGGGTLFFAVPLPEPDNLVAQANLEKMQEIERLAVKFFGVERVFVPLTTLVKLPDDKARAGFIEQLLQTDALSRSGYVSRNGGKSLLLVRHNTSGALSAVNEEVATFEKELADHGFAEGVIVTGLRVLMAREFTRLIDQLRVSLMIAIALGIVFLGFATRSISVLVSAIIPNLIPIFLAQSFIYFNHGSINLIEVVGLTIAFGIAIDNAVHFINAYDAEKRDSRRTAHGLSPDLETSHALSHAIYEVTPALTAGTVILCFSVLVTQISVMPVVPVLGKLIMATLFIALISNILLLPAYILTFERIKLWWIRPDS